MTFACALLLSACAAVNWRLFRSVLCPPVLFSGLWGAILFGLVLSGSDFYPLSLTTLGLCLLSVLSLSLGYRFVGPLRRNACRTLEARNAPYERLYLLRILDIALGLCVAILPVYWSRLSTISQESLDPNFLRGVRAQMVSVDAGLAASGSDFFTYVLPIMTIMTLIATVESYRGRERKWRIAAWTIVSLSYYIPTGSRLAAIVLLVSVVCAMALSSGRLRLRTVLAAGMVFVPIYSFAAITLGKGGSPFADTGENASGVARSFRLYALSGIVACDQAIQAGTSTGERQMRSLRFFYALGRGLGFDVDVPDTLDGPIATPDMTNVYTIYYYYFKDFGWLGVAAIFVALGALLRILFNHALSGRPEATVLSGLSCAFLVLTCAGDPFLRGLSLCIQVAGEVFLVYRLSRLIGSTVARRFQRHSAAASSSARPYAVPGRPREQPVNRIGTGRQQHAVP
jgi:oligosaccharide repeat unit polymerase